MKRRYKVWITDHSRPDPHHRGYLEVWSGFGAFGACLKVWWWKLTGNAHYHMYRHWPLSKS